MRTSGRAGPTDCGFAQNPSRGTKRVVMRFLFLMLLVLGGGCAKYEFDIVEPPDLARHVGRDQETVLKRDELEYRMQAVEGRLVMHVVNATDEQIELIGPESTAVDQWGQSHPFRGQA